MHGQMHPNYWQITILLVVDPLSSLTYFMMTQPLPIASKLPIKTLVAKQLPTNVHVGIKFGGLAVYIITAKLKSAKISNSHIYIWRSRTEPPNLNPPIFF